MVKCKGGPGSSEGMKAMRNWGNIPKKEDGPEGVPNMCVNDRWMRGGDGSKQGGLRGKVPRFKESCKSLNRT